MREKGDPSVLVTFEPGKLTIANETASGTSTESLTCEDGPKSSLRVNPLYLHAAIENIDGEDVEMHAVDAVTELRIRNKSGSQIAVVMPKSK